MPAGICEHSAVARDCQRCARERNAIDVENRRLNRKRSPRQTARATAGLKVTVLSPEEMALRFPKRDSDRLNRFTPYGVLPGERKRIGTSTKPFRRATRKEIYTLGSDLGGSRLKSLFPTI